MNTHARILRQALFAGTAATVLTAALPVCAQSSSSAPVTTAPPSSQAPTDQASAPSATAATTTAASGATVKEIVVTGSSIRGAAPVGSAVTTVNRQDIVNTGATNTTEVLRSVPEVGSFNSTGPNVGGNQANFLDQPAIHGIGVGNGGGGLTLVLLDGHRLPGAGINQTTPDAGVIPTSALERVEVIADGASSIYGSDAVAGVINFILRKNFDGAETTGKIGFGDGYQTESASQLIGKSWDSGSIILDYEHSGNTDLVANKRSYITDNQTSHGDGDNRSTICSPANVTVGGTTYGLSSTGVATAGVPNKCEANQDSDLYPSQHRDTGFISIRQNVTPDIELFGTALYSHREITYQQGADSGTESLGGLAVNVPGTSPYYIQIPGTATGATQSVTYNPSNDLGTFQNTITTSTWNQTVGANVGLGHDWKGTVEGNFGYERDDVREHGMNQTLALDAAENGTLNPYGIGPANNSTLTQELKDYQTRYVSRQTLEEGIIKADGPIFDLPAGAIKGAFGVDIQHSTDDAFNSNGPVGTYSGLTPAEQAVTNFNTAGDRTIESVFGELFIPVVDSANSLPLIRKLTVSASARFDNYSDVGNTTNPRVGVNWTPVDGLKFRASYSTSFHAPSLADTGGAIDTRAIRFADFTGSTNPNAYSVILAGGNSHLVPETAINYSAGVDWNPPFLPDFNASLGYFDIDYKNVITFPTFGPVTDPTNPAYAPFAYLHPTLAQAEALTAGFRHDGAFDVTSQLPTAIYDLRRQNFATEYIDGFDFNAQYHFRTDYGSVVTGLAGTYLLGFNQKINGSNFNNNLLNTDYAINLKLRGTIAWSYDAYNVALFVNHTNGYNNNNVTPNQKVDAFNTVDLHVGWNVPATGWFSGIQLTVDAENLFDADPPFFYNPGDNTSDARGYDPTAASALGRVVEVGLRKHW